MRIQILETTRTEKHGACYYTTVWVFDKDTGKIEEFEIIKKSRSPAFNVYFNDINIGCFLMGPQKTATEKVIELVLGYYEFLENRE